MLLTQNPNEPNKADGNGASTSPSTGAQKSGIALIAIALAGGVAMTVKKKEKE